MKKWLLIPTVLFPYLSVAAIAVYFILGSQSDTFATVFGDRIGVIGLVALLLLLLAVLCNLAFLFTNRVMSPDELVYIALIVKCLQVPVYVLIFALGLILGLMVFMTLPLILLLIFLDLVFLWLSNMLSIYAIARIKDRPALRTGVLICQFFFCMDIGSLLVARALLNRPAP